MFEVVVTLLDTSFVHGFISEGQLNPVDGLSLSIVKLFVKFDSITLLYAFGYLNI